MVSKSNLKKWHFVLDFLIENVAVLFTVGFASYIIYKREIAKATLSIEDLLTAVLEVLALLAVSELVERYRKLNDIEKSVHKSLALLKSSPIERPSAVSFFQKTPPLDKYIQGASQIDLCGVTLTSTLSREFGNLRERLRKGAHIRILLSDPSSLALEMSAERSKFSEVDYYEVRLEAAFREIGHLSEQLVEVKKEGASLRNVGRLEVRLLSYAPSFAIFSFDANQQNGVVFVEIYPHKFGHDKQPPTFSLRPERDGGWYKYFVEQFEAMWDTAKKWEG